MKNNRTEFPLVEEGPWQQSRNWREMLVIQRTVQVGVKCGICGSGDLTSRKEIDEFEYGIKENSVTLQTSVDVYHCEDCQFDFTGPSAELARHEAVCRHLDVMTPSEVKDIRGKYCMSRASFALLTGLGEASIGRWEAGSHIQNRGYDNFLFLLRFEENLERINARSDSFAVEDDSMVESAPGEFRCLELTEQMRESQAKFKLRLH